MGGKTKQSQRTKNNARPSSSGRSALLLSNAKLEPGVMNIAGTELPALFPTLVAPSIDPLVSPELQLCLKKLNKKDPITKTKALQELSELVSNSKVDDVVAALPSWAHFYRILTADPDRKVREATQYCHGSVVAACGRRVAPTLRALAPAWLTAQYDDHAPARAHANNSLNKTFPDNKLPEVISFCKNEVMAHLVDNLIGAGDAAFIRKTDTPEEKEAQTVRIVTSSLHGLQYITQHLPSEHDDWLWEQLSTVLQNNVFWKKATNTDSRIRAAWYSAMGRIIARYGGTFGEQFGPRTLRALAAARESSPLAAAQLWDSLLLFMYSVQDWHKYLDKKELLNKRILDVLESGGWGDARHLSNILLPLLAHLPDNMLTKEFYLSFFDAILNGLDKKSILSSKSERQCWITNLDECLRYLSIQQHDYVLEIVTSVHRRWLEIVLSDAHDGPIRTNLIKYSANNMAALIKYWLRQAKEGHSEKYDQLIRNFWQNVGSTITTQIDKLSTDHADIGKLIDGHILLLHTLKTSFVQEAKKQQSIKFDGDSPSAVEVTPKETQQCDASIVERYNHNLNDLIEKVCGNYFEYASKKEISSPVLSPLITLLVEYDSSSLFTAIARHFDCDCTYKFYEKVLRTWLTGDTMRCKAVVDIIFLLLKHLTEQEQDALFESFKQFPPAVVEWCISLSLSHPAAQAAPVRRWVRGVVVRGALHALTARLLRTGRADDKSLLLMCLNHDSNGEMLISPEAISDIVRQLSAAVSDVSSPQLDQLAGLCARLGSALPTSALPDLILPLFQLSVALQRGDGRVSVETWEEAGAAWRDALRDLPPDARKDLRARALHVLQQHLFHIDKSLDLKRMEHIVSLCPHLLINNSEEDITEIVNFTRLIFDIGPNDPTQVETFVLRHNIVKGDINCPIEDGHLTKAITDDYTNNTLDDITEENLTSYMTKCVFRVMYLRTILLHKVDEDLEDTWCNDLLADEYFVQEFCKVLYDFMVTCSMYDAYAFSPHYPLVKNIKSRMDNLIVDIIAKCTANTKSRILVALAELAATHGYYWAFARRWFEVISKRDLTDPTICCQMPTRDLTEECFGETETPSKTETGRETEDQSKPEESQGESETSEGESLDLENMKEIVTGNGYFHILQANERWCPVVRSSLRTKYLVMLRSLYAAHSHQPDVVGEKFIADVMSGQAECSADVIVNAYYAHNHIMLFEKDITESPWAAVCSNAAVAQYLRECVRTRGWTLPPHHWDFLAIALCHLLCSGRAALAHWGSTKVALLTHSALHLYLEVEKFISSIKERSLQQQPSDHVAHLPTEWNDIFAPDLHVNLFSIIVYVLESSTNTMVTANHIAVIDALIQCTRQVQWDALPEQRKGAELSLQRLVAVATKALQEPAHYSFKYLAYYLLQALLKPLVLDDAAKLSAWSVEASEETDAPPPQFSLLYYDETFFQLQEIVEVAVAHVQICEETCELVQLTDVHSLALGWFLLSEVMWAHSRLARGDLTHHYIQIYREQKYAEPLLTSALRLLPAEVFSHGHEESPVQQRHLDMFTSVLRPDVYQYAGSSAVSVAACRGVSAAVRGPGAGEARGWRGAAPHRHAHQLDRLVARYISPQAVKEQFLLLQQRASELEDTEISVHWSTYEVTSILYVEERPIELKVQLSRSHPLGLPKFSSAHPAANNTGWLVMYMGYQNGSLVNALKMWIAGVHSKVERGPQCYICYCRLHHSTGRLPAALCRQCRNKFHTPCLRKWFATSTKSNCPLCRAPF